MVNRIGTLTTRLQTEGFEQARSEIRGYGTEVGRTERTSDNFNKTTQQTTGRLGDVRAGTLLAAAGFAVLTRGIVRAGNEASTLALRYDRALTEVTTLLSGGAEQTARLREETLRLSTLYSSDATQQATSYYNIISAGISEGVEANGLLNNANILATASITGLDTATQLLTGTFNAFAPQGTEVTEIMDVLFGTVENGIINMRQLAMALPVVSAVAANLGITLVDISAGLAALTSTGILPQIAATQLRSLALGFQRLTEDQRELATQLGVTSFASSDYIQIVGELREGLAQLGSDQERNTRLFEIFGTNQEQYNAILALTGGAYESLIGAQDRLTNSAGAAQTAYEKVADSISNRLLIAQNDIEASNIRLGTQINNVLVPAIELKADAYELAADNADALAGILVGSLVTVAIPVAVAGFRSLATAVGFATFGISTALGLIAAFTATAIVAELNKVTFSAGDMAEAVEDINDAYATFVDDGTERSLTALIKLAEGHAAATVQIRQQALADLELLRIQGLTAAGADPRFAERYAQAEEAVRGATEAVAEAEIRLSGYRTELELLPEPQTAAQMKQGELEFSMQSFLKTTLLVNPAVADYSDNLLDTERPTIRTREETDKLRDSMLEFLTAQGLASDSNDAWGDSLIDAKDASQEFADFLNSEYEDSVRGVGTALGEVAIGGIDTWRDFETAVTNSAKRAVANIIAEFTSTALLGALANVRNLITGANLGAGVATGAPTAGGFLGAGAGAGIGASLLQLSGLGAIVGAGGLVLNSLFGQRAVSDENSFNVGADGSVGGTNTRVSRRNFDGTLRVRTRDLGRGDLGDEVNDGQDGEVRRERRRARQEAQRLLDADRAILGSFTNQATAVQGAVRELGDSLGVSLGSIATSGAVANAQQYANILSDRIIGDADLARQGENSTQTLQRLSLALSNLNLSAETLGLTTLDLSVANAGASQEIIDLVGGLENLRSGQAGLFQFLSPEQQASQLGGLVRDILGSDLTSGQQLIDQNNRDIAVLNDPNSTEAQRDAATASQGVLLNQENQRLFAAVLSSQDRSLATTSGARGISLSGDNFVSERERRIAETTLTNLQGASPDQERNDLLKQQIETMQSGFTQMLDGLEAVGLVMRRANT